MILDRDMQTAALYMVLYSPETISRVSNKHSPNFENFVTVQFWQVRIPQYLYGFIRKVHFWGA
jgi:hypothetical protein